MSTLAEGPRGLDYLALPQTYQTSGVHCRGHVLPSHHDVSALSSPTASDATPIQAPGRMKLRSSGKLKRAPNWASFYKNGLPRPQDVIVIEDTPEPNPNTAGKETASTRNGAPGDTKLASPHTPRKKRKLSDPKNQSAHGSRLLANAPSSKTTHHASSGLSDFDYYHSAGDATDRAGHKRRRLGQNGTITAQARQLEAQGVATAHEEYRGLRRRVIKVAKVAVRVVNDARKDKKTRLHDEDGHFIVIPDTDLANQYRITKLLGQGTFGKVVQAFDRESGQAVAVKIVRAVPKYRDAAQIELRALQTLRRHDAENRYRCIHLRDCFDYHGHICLVTDLLGLSLFDFLKLNDFVPFPNSHIQSFARQLLTSIAFLHDLKLIHTDLKPENILLCDAGFQVFTYNRRVPSSQYSLQRQASHRKVLYNSDIRLIDFGSATFQDEYHSSVVSTRHYRAPEVILGLGWSFPCDIWSVGCILVELYTGDALFQTHDNLEHLAIIEAVCGTKIDPRLAQKVAKPSSRSELNPAAKYFKEGKLDFPTQETTRASRRFVQNMKKLDEIIPHQRDSFMKNFLDLLKMMFAHDPSARITAKEALQHPWFKEAANDDGTEATRLKLQRALSRGSGASSTGNPSIPLG